VAKRVTPKHLVAWEKMGGEHERKKGSSSGKGAMNKKRKLKLDVEPSLPHSTKRVSCEWRQKLIQRILRQVGLNARRIKK